MENDMHFLREFQNELKEPVFIDKSIDTSPDLKVLTAEELFDIDWKKSMIENGFEPIPFKEFAETPIEYRLAVAVKLAKRLGVILNKWGDIMAENERKNDVKD